MSIVCLQLLLLVQTLLWTSVQMYCTGDVETEFINSGLQDDLVSVAPKELVHVVFNNKDVVCLGKQLIIAKTVLSPTHVSWDADCDKLYSLFLIDPDPVLSQVVHWRVINIKGNNYQGGDVINEYLAPGPEPSHRYTFLVYEQREYIHLKTIKKALEKTDGLLLFNVEDFAEKYNLIGPVYGNFYRALKVEAVEKVAPL